MSAPYRSTLAAILLIVAHAAVLPIPALATQADNPVDTHPPGETTPLKRIAVVETNNHRLDRGFSNLPLPDTPFDETLAGLRQFMRPHLGGRAYDELELMFAITAAVDAELTHQAFGEGTPEMSALEILQAARDGKRFSCVEHAKVLTDVLLSQGIPARTLSLQGPDIAYGGLASGHVLTEAWSNKLDKWILLDAQWGVYAEREGAPVNVYEIYEAKKKGKLTRVKFKPVAGEPTRAGAAALSNEYRAFLRPYLGYISARLNVPVMLRLEGASWPLTFQGLPFTSHVFAKDPEDIYFGVNHTSLMLKFRPESQPTSRLAFNLMGSEDYLRRMPEFAAVPDFDVTLNHNMPWFDHFEYALDDADFSRVPALPLRWTLHEGDNQLRVRAINQAGRAGPPTFMHIRYSP